MNACIHLHTHIHIFIVLSSKPDKSMVLDVIIPHRKLEVEGT